MNSVKVLKRIKLRTLLKALDELEREFGKAAA